MVSNFCNRSSFQEQYFIIESCGWIEIFSLERIYIILAHLSSKFYSHNNTMPTIGDFDASNIGAMLNCLLLVDAPRK